jgi:hypothetical protein
MFVSQADFENDCSGGIHKSKTPGFKTQSFDSLQTDRALGTDIRSIPAQNPECSIQLTKSNSHNQERRILLAISDLRHKEFLILDER